VSPQLYGLFLYAMAAIALLGGTVGTLSGWLVHSLLRRRWMLSPRVVSYAASGAVSVLTAFFLALIVPVPTHATVTTTRNGSIETTSTSNRFDYPLQLGLVVAALVPVAVERMMSLLSNPIVMRDVEAVRGGEPVHLHAQFVKIGIHRQGHQDMTARLVMLREPLTGLYWWDVLYDSSRRAAADPPEPRLGPFIRLTDEQVVYFNIYADPFRIRSVRGRKSDFLAIQQAALAEVEQYLRKNDRQLMPGDQLIELRKVIAPDFFRKPGSAQPYGFPVSSVTRTDGRWNVTVRGLNDIAVVTLNDQFAVERVRDAVGILANARP